MQKQKQLSTDVEYLSSYKSYYHNIKENKRLDELKSFWSLPLPVVYSQPKICATTDTQCGPRPLCSLPRFPDLDTLRKVAKLDHIRPDANTAGSYSSHLATPMLASGGEGWGRRVSLL